MIDVLELDLSLHPDDVAPLLRLPEIAKGGRRGRPCAVHIVWHDTPAAALAADGLALAERRQGRETRWRLERTRPLGSDVWAPGTLPALVAEGDDPAELGQPLPQPLLPIAAFEGQMRAVNGGAMTVSVLSGELRAVARARPVCRVTLAGAAEAVAPFVHTNAQSLRLTVPAAVLAAEALGTARPPAAARRLGAPALPASLSVGEAFAFIVAHLADVILFHAPKIRAGEAPEPVHQMRVAVRRLRSALKLFGKAVACPELEAATTELKALNGALGPARDWDVFTGSTVAAVASTLPDDPGFARLTGLARRRRDAAYAALGAYLDGPAFRQLCLSLATLAAARPWERIAGDPTAEAESVDDLTRFATKALDRRFARLTARGEDIRELPATELHVIRIDAKRLRYAAEFFAPLFPGRETRRFLRRLAALQERLGLLNDGAVAAGLLEEIGQANGYAGGLVRGFIAAGSTDARDGIDRVWRKFVRRAIPGA
ncbi:MAG TPA: CHAD domain-containing protein [Acetobacteraceae bacterium]|nr:CHAD domain-containing protein [Acetobacteraceae bacterium]